MQFLLINESNCGVFVESTNRLLLMFFNLEEAYKIAMTKICYTHVVIKDDQTILFSGNVVVLILYCGKKKRKICLYYDKRLIFWVKYFLLLSRLT